MTRKYWNLGIGLCFLAAFLPACSQEGSEKVYETDECPPQVETQVAEQLDTLNIIIETSGSMAGFMPSRAGTQTQFQQQIDEMLANAESLEGNRIRTLRYYAAREKMYKEVYSRFSQMLRQGLRNAGSSSPIPRMLQNISNTYASEGQVTIFISDFIYAPPNRRDRDFIANDIRRAIGDMQREGMVISVFAAQSDFHGTFYPAGSKSGNASSGPIRNCCDTPIPYYVWVMGPAEKVRLINQEVVRNNFLEQMHFGYEIQDPPYRIIPGSGRMGEWYPVDQEGKTIQLDNPRAIGREPQSYTIGINLNGLPGQVADTEYLRDNLLLQVRNGEASLEEVYDYTSFTAQEDINNKDRSLLNCFTHYVKISVDKVFDPNKDVELNLLLENRIPGWVEEYTTSDDSRIEEVGPKTFALEAIMEGANRASSSQSDTFFNLETTIDLSR